MGRQIRAEKALLILLLASLLACSSKRAARPPPPAPRPAPAGDAWGALEDKCELDREADRVTCPRPEFFEAGLSYLRVSRQLEKAEVGLETTRELAVVDSEVWQGRVDEAYDEADRCYDKLSSPWRSPLLWGLVAGLVGFGGGLAVAQVFR
jgi:hypothetical protein